MDRQCNVQRWYIALIANIAPIPFSFSKTIGVKHPMGVALGNKRRALVCALAHADEKWRCARATTSQLIVPSSLRLQLKVDCCTRFARLVILQYEQRARSCNS